jgi:hypothetical protein
MQIFRLSNRVRFSPGVYLAALSLIIVMSIFIFLGSSLPPVSSPSTNVPSIASAFSQLPLAFVPNQGQDDPVVQFEVNGAGNKLTFAPQAITLQVQEQTVQLNFVDSNPAPTITADNKLPGIVNYFQGNQPDSWLTNIPTYAAIHYQELYPDINLRYEGNDGLLESTFTVAPGADPALIRWQYSGATTLTVDEATGDLHITLPDQSKIVEQAPIAWQDIDGQRISVTSAFSLAADNSVGFTLGSYDATLPLIIDPTIVYETTLNVGDFGQGLDVAVDAAGNAYVLGRLINLGNDTVIVKLAPNGSVLYTTYLSAHGIDAGWGIALDGSGDVYVAGYTDSQDFPILNAIKSTKEHREGFITKLAAADGSLLFSTYFGGSRADEIHDIALNSAGEIYVVGYTESTDFPTENPIQGGLNLNQCFCEDTFVTKLSPDALTVLFSTYLGGSFEDYGQSIALDADDNIYITGRTQSDDFPTQAAIQPNRAGTNQDEDLFVSKISADGSSLVYSTYLGGTEDESTRRIAVDSAGNAFVAGTTLSDDFPTTAGAYRETYIGGHGACLSGFSLPVDCSDIFVTKFVPDGSSLAYSTYVGGGKHDFANGVAINNSGEAYVVGYTNSTDIPGADQNGILLAKLNANGSNLLYAVGMSSPYYNSGHGIAVDNAGDVYITGAQNFPEELYVARFTEGGAPPPTNTPVSPTNTPVPPTDTPVPPTNTPVPPTPTPTSGNTLHIGDLDGNSSWLYRQRLWGATATIVVHDENHDPVGGVTVSGNWNVGFSPTNQCVSSSDGSCTVFSGYIWSYRSNATFTMNNAAGSLTYVPANNHDPDGDSNGTSIVVTRP